MANIINTKENIFYNLDYKSFFDEFAEAVKTALERYWETDVKLRMFAINDFKNIRDEYFIKNSDFFTSQIKIDYHKPVVVRLDKDFVNNFLNVTLEGKQEIDKLKKLTNLEMRILNNFCEYLYRQIEETLISPKQAKITAKSEKNFNFIISASANEDTCAKIMFSIPQDRVNLVELQHSQAFSDECFINSYAYVKIRAGYTKLTLEELKSLSKDDIIVLEDSTINKLTLISGNIEKDFRVEIDKSLILKMDSNDENNEETEYGVEMEKNLWDNIQIELSAEFSKVKMTIGELKQITKGQIVDLGSVFDNEISLYIENKKVAKGELLIINDKYAVRLNEVLNSDVAASAPSEAQSNKPAEKPQKQAKAEAPQQQKVEDEEFDYSDFEN